MLPLPAPDPPTGSHPAWCSPAHCQVNELGDVQHRSSPVSSRFAAGDVEITVARNQHGSYLGEQPPPSYLITITHTELHEQMTVEAADEDTTALCSMIERLGRLQS